MASRSIVCRSRIRNIFGKRSDLPFPRKSDRKKEKRVVSFTHEQNIICSQTKLDDIAHEENIICWKLFAGYVVGSRPMKRKTNFQRMITSFEIFTRQESRFPLIKCKDKSLIHMVFFSSSKDVLLCYPVLRRVLGCKGWNEV